MNEHERYMADFFRVYETLERWGPGSDSDTLKALSNIPYAPKKILELGCGKGIATTVLAAHTNAQITAVDNEVPALECLTDQAQKMGVDTNITTVCASMTDLPFEAASFDVIWSEGSAYIMGVTKALKEWRKLLEDKGILVFSDLVWLTDSPSAQAASYWNNAYTEMTTVDNRIRQAKDASYEVLNSFTLSEDAWRSYVEPLQERVNAVKAEMTNSPAITDIEEELEIFSKYMGEFSYQMFVLKKL